MAASTKSSMQLAQSAGTESIRPIDDFSTPRSPRESMRCAGKWTQPLLTALTGTPLPDERPIWLRTPVGRFAQTMIFFGGSIVASAVLATSGPWAWLLLPLTWLLTVNAARNFQTNFVHHATHGNFTGSPRWDRLLGEFASTLALIQPMSAYGADHKKHHGHLGLEPDPDLQFLIAMGFRPGQTMRWYWSHLFKSMFSPTFHAMYFTARIRANFLEAPPLRRAAAIAWTLALLTPAALAGASGWLTLALAIFIPLFPLYHISGMLQVLTEHQWVRTGDGSDPARLVLARLTSARFSGEHAPALTGWRSFPAWTWWWFKMLTVHAFTRLFVVVGDLPNHDWHHRYPGAGVIKPGSTPADLASNWANAAYARRDDLLRGSPGWPAYTEFWSLRSALRATFLLLASLPKDAQLGKPLTYLEQQQNTLGM